MRKLRKHYFGPQFDERRTDEAHGDTAALLGNFVSLAVKAGSTHFEHLMAIGRSFPVKYLSPKLKEPQFLRGKTYFGDLIDEINKILLNHPELRWWMTSDGLVVDEVPSELDSLSHFDRIVGPLSIQLLQNGRLSQDAIHSIAIALDAEKFTLKEHLQPQEWDDVVDNNRKRTGNPIKSFSSAAKNPRFVQPVRRSIYRARDRYKKALSLQS